MLNGILIYYMHFGCTLEKMLCALKVKWGSAL